VLVSSCCWTRGVICFSILIFFFVFCLFYFLFFCLFYFCFFNKFIILFSSSWFIPNTPHLLRVLFITWFNWRQFVSTEFFSGSRHFVPKIFFEQNKLTHKILQPWLIALIGVLFQSHVPSKIFPLPHHSSALYTKTGEF
jgi:hypothetical protein